MLHNLRQVGLKKPEGVPEGFFVCSVVLLCFRNSESSLVPTQHAVAERISSELTSLGD